MQGLKPGQIRALERLYKRRLPSGQAWTAEQARELASLSRLLNRQLGLLVDRKGKIQLVIAGTATGIYIPELPRVAPGRLRGLRLLHTHLSSAPLDQEDLMDMLFLRLDAATMLESDQDGEPGRWQSAWICPPDPPQSLLELKNSRMEQACLIGPLRAWHDSACDFSSLARDIETRLGEGIDETFPNRCLLVSVSPESHASQAEKLAELKELAISAGLEVAATLAQRAQKPDPRYILGRGKLMELEVQALQARADLLIFDGELAPAQLHNLADVTERRVIDRTQLILDIFAQRASSRAGKLQVELAQLAYAQPRLAGKHNALDRLMGGIGGRGPGESRLETDRRKSRTRMAQLKRELEQLQKQRALARKRREQNRIPLVALAGYTNSGKSTLLNTLTQSRSLAENRLFATLDPVTRRLRFPEEREIAISDTVGFIRNLPAELTQAFHATLEELGKANLLIHVADASHPQLEKQILAVETVFEDLGLAEYPRLLALNKCDLLSESERHDLACAWPHAAQVSGLTGAGLAALLRQIEMELFMECPGAAQGADIRPGHGAAD
ncbi:MAG: GTPase HflX [Desulfovibrio sp.]|nr:GTPase HflX [Desulfovibrio sp.]